MFDQVPEQSVIFLIDTSSSMFHKLDSVKCEMMNCLDSLLRKVNARVNLIEFNTRVTQWARSMCQCNPETLTQAKEWLLKLEAISGTNTEAAFMSAFDEEDVEAVYLITDGLPESNTVDFLDRVSHAAAARPIHCSYLTGGASDEAATWLFLELAKRTGGSLNLVSINDDGVVDRVSRLYKLAHPPRQQLKKKVRNRSSKKESAGASEKVPPDSCIVRPLSAAVGACVGLHRPDYLFPIPPAYPLFHQPRVYIDNNGMVLRLPRYSYRWPHWNNYWSLRHPYVGHGYMKCRLPREEARESQDECSDNASVQSDNSDSQSREESANEDVANTFVPETGMTTSELGSKVAKQIERHHNDSFGELRGRKLGRKQDGYASRMGQSSSPTDPHLDTYDEETLNRLEINRLERLLDEKKQVQQAAVKLRTASLDDEISANIQERNALAAEYSDLQRHRLTLRSSTPHSSPLGISQKSLTFDHSQNTGRHYSQSNTVGLSQTSHSAPQLVTPPSNDTWLQAKRRVHEHRSPWRRYWRSRPTHNC